MTTEIQTPEIKTTSWADDLRPATRLWVLLLAMPILAVMAFAIFQPIQVLPRISLAPAYTFHDQDGTRLTSEDLRGALTLYTFAHSGCVDPCVPTTQALADLQPALSNMELDGIPLRFVTMYVDPEAATPARLQTIAQELGADAEQWRFVTGDANQLRSVIGGFRTDYGQQADGSYTVDPVFVLVDGWGIVRATYRTAVPDLDLLQRDLGLIVQEAANSTGVSRYAYEAAHLFMCYPK